MTQIKWEVWYTAANGIPLLYCSYNDDAGTGELAATYKKETLIHAGYENVLVKKVETEL